MSRDPWPIDAEFFERGSAREAWELDGVDLSAAERPPEPGVDARFIPTNATPDGQIIRFAAGLSNLSGGRRLVARVFAVAWLAVIVLSLLAGLVEWA